MNKELAGKMINLFYFADRALQIRFNINLGSHNINHANSVLTIEPHSPVFGIELRYFSKILKEMAIIFSRLKNQNKYNYHTFFSASFYKINEEDQRNDEIELNINLIVNHKLTDTEIDDIDIKPQLEHQIQIQKTKECG